MSLVIYAFDGAAFKRLEDKQSKIEADIFNPEKQEELFEWMIEKFDLLVNALVSVGELDNEESSNEKFSELRSYLESCGKNELTSSFAEIENIIGTELCKSAYTYSVYWKPSATHTMANAILEAGYKVVVVDLVAKKIELEKIY